MIAATELRLILVTPETTLLDAAVRSVVIPLFDGQLGVLPGRAPMVGRLGAGELRFEGAGGSQRYFIDGGFVQIKGSVVSVLTHQAMPADKINVSSAEAELAGLAAQPAVSEEALTAKWKAQQRARRMIAMKRR